MRKSAEIVFNQAKMITVVQSNWTRGMQSPVLSARNDTDILGKGAAILDNVVIMQQGGLKKRPCTVLSCNGVSNQKPIGVTRLGEHLWQIFFDGSHTLSLFKINSNEGARTINLAQGSEVYDNVNFIQDGNVLLFTPFWTNVVYNVNSDSFSTSAFIFNSLPVSPKIKNSDTLTNYNANGQIYVQYRGDGSVTALQQAQTPNSFIAVGNNVIVYADINSNMQFSQNFILGTIIEINGLIIRFIETYTREYLGNTLVALYGVVMYGSDPVQALTKLPQSFTDGWTNVYTVSVNASDIIVQTLSFNANSLPHYVTNFQNRLITGFTKGILNNNPLINIPPNNTTIWCSGAGNKFSYLQTNSEDDAPFSVNISGDISPQINNIISGDYLYICTNVGIYAFVNSTNSTFTPNNINLRKIGNHRCNNTQAIQHDGELFYVQENGKAIFSLSTDGTNILDIDRTILCPTFFSNVSHLCATNYISNINPDLASDNSSFLFALSDEINQDNGLPVTVDGKRKRCIVSYQFVSVQEIQGWTRWIFEDNNYPIAIYTCEDRLFGVFTDNKVYEFKYGQYIDTGAVNPPQILIKTNPFSMRDQINGDLLFKRKKFSEICLYYVSTESLKIENFTHNVGFRFNGEFSAPRTDIKIQTEFDNFEILKQVNIGHNHNSDFQLIAMSTQLEIE